MQQSDSSSGGFSPVRRHALQILSTTWVYLSLPVLVALTLHGLFLTAAALPADDFAQINGRPVSPCERAYLDRTVVAGETVRRQTLYNAAKACGSLRH